MSGTVVGLIGFAVFFAMLAVNIPVGLTLALVGFGGLVYVLGLEPAISKLALVPFSVASNYELSCLPFFVLMANVIFETGLGSTLYDLAAKWMGNLRGGLAIATVGACAGFAAISGTSVAGHATMGPVAMPEMLRHGYARTLATGCIVAGGTLGILIPPSGVLIMYGVLTGTSIGELFTAGLLPGIVVALFYMVTIYIVCTIKPALGPRGPKYSLRDKVVALRYCGEVIALVVIVLGGLMIGWFTPTEAGSIGAFGAIVIALIRRRLDWQKFKRAICEAIKITGMIYLVMIGANIFMPFLAVTGIPASLSQFVSGLDLPPVVIMLVIMIVYVILGMFMDTMAMVLITIPIFFPLTAELGFSPIWFGIVVVRVMEVGMITPPVGLGIWVVSGITKTPIETVTRGVVPFIVADVFNFLLLLFVPGVVLLLPGVL